MRVYLAGQYARKEELKAAAAELWQHNIMSCATWLKEPHPCTVTLAEVPESQLVEYAEADLSDIRRADAVLFFSESPDVAVKRGGRHVEFGYALAFNKRVIVIGPKENIFHYLTGVEVYPDFTTALAALK